MIHPTRTTLTPEQIQETVDRLNTLGRIHRGFLVDTGRLAFGPRWQAPMAAALSEVAGRNVSPQSVNNWFITHRPVPAAMYPVIAEAGRRLAANLRIRANRLADIWDPPPRTERPYTEEDLADLEAMRLCEEMIAARHPKEN